MQAANAGHRSVHSVSQSIGLNIRLPNEQVANPFRDIKKYFDRFSGRLEQADGTAWMVLFSQNMLEIALILAEHDPMYEDFVLKFLQRFFLIGVALDPTGGGVDGMWDDEDGFFYDILRLPDGTGERLKVRSLVGLLPLCATTVIEAGSIGKYPRIAAAMRENYQRNADLLGNIADPTRPGTGGRLLLSLVNEARLRRILARMLDEERFLGPHGLRSLSRHHLDHPYEFKVHGEVHRVQYEPAESTSGMFGGNSCYNSPCQLKLDPYEGADRGATKRAVYNASRLSSMDPTRLFTDAQTTEQWRKKEFFSVTKSSVSSGLNDSIMIQLLSHKMKNPKSEGDYKLETDELTCAEDGRELGGYLEKHPNRGMPYGFPPLKQEEFEIIAGWLVQGAKGPTAEQRELVAPKPEDALALQRWEAFLNRDDAKHAVTARYLYEHLFLAHIRFGTPTKKYYELVRSKTPPGTPIDIVATVRPYDDPGVERVYYRFRKIHATIVQKTHMVFDLDDAQLQRFREIFIDFEWLQPPHRVGYDKKVSANPFAAFEQIPPRSRYQFLLDNAQYMIMTFIHGPVCKGQIALNVINDHFWVMFLDPDHDLSVRLPAFLRVHRDKLRMPIERGSDMGIFSALTDEHRKAEVEFYKARQDYSMSHNYSGLDHTAIWKGNRAADAPLLTGYRHFDCASVHKGALGDVPKTLWVMDYPLLERVYYALVAGFDVYGVAGHQLAVRLYMDGLRIEGESYFLDFLPQSSRQEIMQSWYKDVALRDINYYPSEMPAGTAFTTDDPKREFADLNRYFHSARSASDASR